MPLIGGVNLDAIDTQQVHQLGQRYEEDGQIFRYGKYSDAAVPGFIGAGCVFLSNVKGVVTSDYSAANVSQAAGFLQAALTDETFGWYQTRGPNRKAMVSGAVTDGENLVLDAGSDGDVDVMDAGEEHLVVAVALAGDTSLSLLAGDAFINLE